MTRVFLTVFLLLQMFIFVAWGRAEVTFDDISRSLNDSLSGNQLFSMKNIISTILTILFFALAALVFRLAWLRSERQLSQKRRKRISLRPVNRQQRRNWYRLRINSEFKWIIAGEAVKARENQYKTDRLIDISGGGLCFGTAEKLYPGDEIKMLLDTGRDEPMNLSGRVLRVGKEARPDNTEYYKVSVEFGHLLIGKRDKIISYIMKRQRENVQKERHKYKKE